MSVDPRPRLWTANYTVTLLGTVGFFSSFFYLLSVLPDYVDEIGGSRWQIGLVVGGFSVVPIALRPFVGRWSDRGHRKRLMRIGLVSMAGSLGLMVFSADVASLFVLRVVQGFGMAMYPTAAASMVAELAPLPRRGEGLGFFGMATGVAQTLTPAIGVAVAALWGFNAVFLIAAGTAGLTLVLIQRLHEPLAGPTHPEQSGTLFPRPALFPMSIFMTVTFAFAATASFLPLLGDERGLGNVGLFFLVSGAANVAARPVAGAVSDRVGRVPVALPGLAMTVLAMWLLALAHGPLLMLASGLAAGVGLAAAHTALLALAIDRVDDSARGRAAAVLQLAWDISGVAGGIVLGVIASTISVPAVYWFAGLLVIAGIAWLLTGEAARSARLRADAGRGLPVEAARADERRR